MRTAASSAALLEAAGADCVAPARPGVAASSHVPPMTYRDVAPRLFQDIVNERFGPAPGPRGGKGGHDLPLTEKGS